VKNRAMICRALSGHALEVVGPKVVVPKGVRVTFYCERCDSWRVDTWSLNGRLIEARSYKLSTEYHSFVKEHNRAEARGSLLATLKEGSQRETDKTRVRLVPRAGKAGRRRAAHARKRTRDKRRSHA
jgi:hypothetical protein